MKAILDVMEARETTAFRIDLRSERKGKILSDASRVIAGEGGEILAIGTYREKADEHLVHYLRLRGVDSTRLSRVLEQQGFNVLRVRR